MKSHDLHALSLEALHRGLRSRAFTAGELAEAVIANFERHGEAFGAYKTFRPERVRAEAAAADAAFAAGLDLGPLQGLPVSVKDLYGVAGYPTYAGTPRELPEAWRREGPVMSACRASLAVVSGKTHTVEFAFGGLGTNPHWGTPRNPWSASEARAPGGSSAGAGVSLLAGTAVVALGSDTAGSVRCPASATGTVGVKTTAGRWSTDGIVPLSTSLDTAGLLARSAEDAAFAFAYLDPLVTISPLAFLDMARELTPADFKVGICDWFFEDCAVDIARVVEAAADELARAGLAVSRVTVPGIEKAGDLFRRGGLAAPEFAAFISGEMRAYKETLDPNVASRFARMEAITAVDYLHRKREIADLAEAADEAFTEVDFVIAPTCPISPPSLAEIADPTVYAAANLTFLRNTAPANILGLSAITLPAGLDDRAMPVGLQVIAPAGEDERVVAAACAFERVLGNPLARLGTPPLRA